MIVEIDTEQVWRLPEGKRKQVFYDLMTLIKMRENQEQIAMMMTVKKKGWFS